MRRIAEGVASDSTSDPVANLFRDQLDRYGSPTISQRWRQAIATLPAKP